MTRMPALDAEGGGGCPCAALGGRTGARGWCPAHRQQGMAAAWEAMPKAMPDGVTATFTETADGCGRIDIRINGRPAIIVHGDSNEGVAAIEWQYAGAVDVRDALHYATAIIAAARLAENFFEKSPQKCA